MKPLTFPVWIWVNEERRPEKGYPYYVMTTGRLPDDPIQDLPATMPMFRTEEKAKRLERAGRGGHPFRLVAVDLDSFREILQQCRYFKQVVIDMGTEDASMHDVAEVLASLPPLGLDLLPPI